jgi:hypothetical protein
MQVNDGNKEQPLEQGQRNVDESVSVNTARIESFYYGIGYHKSLAP